MTASSVVVPVRQAGRAQRMPWRQRALRMRPEQRVPPRAPQRVRALGVVVSAHRGVEPGHTAPPVSELEGRDVGQRRDRGVMREASAGPAPAPVAALTPAWSPTPATLPAGSPTIAAAASCRAFPIWTLTGD